MTKMQPVRNRKEEGSGKRKVPMREIVSSNVRILEGSEFPSTHIFLVQEQ